MRQEKLLIGEGAVVVLLVKVAVVAAFAGGLGENGRRRRPTRDPQAAGADQIAMKDNAFEPASVKVATGTPLKFEVRNDGQVNHNFTSDGARRQHRADQAGESRDADGYRPRRYHAVRLHLATRDGSRSRREPGQARRRREP